MSVVWGTLFAAGILLISSPWVWPRRSPSRSAEDSSVRRYSGLRRLMDDAGFAHVHARVALIVSTVAAALSSAAVWILVPVPAVAVLALIGGSLVPVIWLRARRRQRVRARRTVWPDVCDLLIASVRAGMSLPTAISSLASSAPPSVRAAFHVFESDINASGHFNSSILRLKAALADPVADRIIETLRTARRVGGTELVPVLRALTVAVRADAALRAEVEARQSWTRGAATLGVIAPWVVLTLLALRPEGARAYASPEGAALILVGAVISVAAFQLMSHIGRLSTPRRWMAGP